MTDEKHPWYAVPTDASEDYMAELRKIVGGLKKENVEVYFEGTNETFHGEAALEALGLSETPWVREALGMKKP